MSHKTVSVSRRVVMVKVKPRPESHKERRPPPSDDPIVPGRVVRKHESLEEPPVFEFLMPVKDDDSGPLLLVLPWWKRQAVVAVAIAVVVALVGGVLLLLSENRTVTRLPETIQDPAVTQPPVINIRPMRHPFSHRSTMPMVRPREPAIGAKDRKLVLPPDVSGACSIDSGGVDDLIACLNRYGARAE